MQYSEAKIVLRYMRRSIYKIIAWSCIVFASLLTGCTDEDYNGTYSHKYKVQFYYTVVSSRELTTAVNNAGQYASVRQKGSLILMEGASTTTEYQPDAISAKSFYYGLGGLIIGTSFSTNSHGSNDIVAYDLACPNCDRSERRLSIDHSTGLATCSRCKTQYDLNNYGSISYFDEESSTVSKPRGLYRYRISYDGNMVRVYN